MTVDMFSIHTVKNDVHYIPPAVENLQRDPY